MRKFRLIRYCDDYDPLKEGEVYPGDFIPEGWGETIQETARRFPKEWAEVFFELG